MSGVERVEYMDNQRSGIMTESIQKEKRIQQAYFKEQVGTGRLKPRPPTPKKEHKSLLETIGVPDFVTTHRADPIQAMGTSISKNMWTCNPGYLVRNGPRMASSFKQDFVYDVEEVEYMKQQGYLAKTHNRRRDEFVMYVEAHARMHNLIKGGPSGGAGK